MNFAGKFDFSLSGADANPGSAVDMQAKTEGLGHGQPAIVVPDAYLLFCGDYKRAGFDLVLSKDGHDHVVHDYFKGHFRATLTGPDGAQLSGALVDALTGEVQVAQLAGATAAATVIGRVTKLTGSATAIRNGVSIQLNMGDTVNKGDVVQAGSDSSLGLTFIDGTVFGLSSNARMVLNEMVYDPNGSSNSSLLSLVQGTITFVAGETAKHGDMRVDTPVATMGIRGTAVLVEIDFSVPGANSSSIPVKFQVLREPDGSVGSYVLYSRTDPTQAIATINRAGEVTSYNANGVLSVAQVALLTPEAKAIVDQTLQSYFPTYVPTPQSTTPSGSPPSNPTQGVPSLDPLKFTPSPGDPVAPPFTVPINLPGDSPTTPPVIVTITRFNTAPTIVVAPVVVTLPVDKNSFNLADQVTITDPDNTGGTINDVAVPYVAGTGKVISAAGPAGGPASADLASLVTVDPATGHVSYDPAAFKFLPVGTAVVFTIGFDSRSGPDTIHETITFTVDGSNDAPVVAAALTAAAHEGNTPFTADLLAGALDADLGETATLAISNVTYKIGNGAVSATVPAGVSLSGGTLSIDPANAAFDYLALGETTTFVVSYTITDAHGATVAQTETITITGTNDIPVVVANGTIASSIGAVAGSQATAGGTILFSDADLTDTHTGFAAHAGSGSAFGNLTLSYVRDSVPGTPGQFNWSYSAATAAIEAALLTSASGALADTFNVTITDGHGGTVTQGITIDLSADRWIGGTGSASNGANWSLGHAPTASQLVLFNSSSNVILDGAFPLSIAGAVIAAGTTVNLSGATPLVITGMTTNAGEVALAAGAALTFTTGASINNAQGQITVDNGAALTLNGATITDGTITNTGYSTFAGNSESVTSTFGAINLTGGATISGGTLYNSGEFTVSGAGNLLLNEQFSNYATMTVLSGGVLTLTNSTVSGGYLYNSGTVHVEGSTGATLDGVTVDGSGMLQVDEETIPVYVTLTLSGGTTIENGILSIGNVGAIDISDSAAFSNETVLNSGVISVLFGATLTLDNVSIGGGALNIDGMLQIAAFSTVTLDSNTITEGESGSISVGAGATLVIGTDGADLSITAGDDAVVNVTGSNETLHITGNATVHFTGTGNLVFVNDILVSNGDHAAVIGTPGNADVTEDASAGTLTATGSISISDADAREGSFRTAVKGAEGNLGQLVLAADGTYGYSVANADVQFLSATGTHVDTFTVTALDGTSRDISFTIHGVNDAPVVAAALTASANEGDARFTANLLCGASDVDAGETALLAVTHVSYRIDNGTASATAPAGVSLDGGILSIDPANTAFSHLGLGQTTTIVVSYDVTDVNGATVAQTETITITGSNENPVIAAGSTTSGAIDVPLADSTSGTVTPGAAAILAAGPGLISNIGGATGYGSVALPAGDDNSSNAIDITSVFGANGVNFFGTHYTSIYVNNNGNITFGSPSGTYTPSTINAGFNNPIIAAFWADVDTRGHGAVYYDLDSIDGVMTITWDQVGYFAEGIDKLNSFQIVLVNEGGGNFDIVYRYADINWTTGGASGGVGGLGGTPARAGYSAGDGVHYYELPQSGHQDALLTLPVTPGNTGVAGVDGFQVHDGAVGPSTVSTSGAINFSDANAADVHTAHVTSSGHELGTLTLSLVDTTGTGTNGQIAWTYTADAAAVRSALQDDADGIRVDSFNVTLDDGHGGTVSQTVAVTLTGTGNHTPFIETSHLQVSEGDQAEAPIALSGISVSDADSSSDSYGLTLAAGHGSVTDSNGNPLPASFTSLADLNAHLDEGLVYTGQAAVAQDSLTVTVRDSGGATSAMNFVFNVSQTGPVTLNGTAGNDVIIGTSHQDTMTGGSGRDQFVFAANFGHDTVTDFHQAELDRIDLSAVVTTNDLTTWMSQHVAVAANQQDTLITIDANDSILLQHVTGLTASDFIVHPHSGV